MRLVVLVTLLAATASAQPAPEPNPLAGPTAYVGGQWFDGERFVARDTVWADDGVFVRGPLAAPVRVVELGDEYVVPPFGDAHLHAFYQAGSIRSQDSLQVARGVFYVRNPHVAASDRASVDGIPTTVDRSYAVGGITTAASHLATAYEARALGLQPWDVWGARGDEIRASRRVEGDAYHLVPSVADLDAVWPRVQASGTDVLKVILNDIEDWATGDAGRQRGVSPAVLRAVVARAHADGLRVVAHVETAADLRAAIEAGVDALAHAPGYSVVDQDPATAEGGAFALDDRLLRDWAASGIPVTPTLARGPITARYLPSPPSEATLDSVRAYHAGLLRRLDAADVPISFGADAGGLWVWDDAAYAIDIGGLSKAAALRAWSVTTPRDIFPDRAIGQLAPGFEASLLSLACDPLADWSCTEAIRQREKQGQAVGQAPRLNPAAPATAYVGGQWWNGERFAARDTVWADDGVFVSGPLAAPVRVVDLSGRYVVPPFGDAHTHMLSDTNQGPGQAELFERDGVFYALVLTDRYTRAAPLIPQFAGPETIDVAYAHGGLTTDRTHPTQVYEWQALRLVGRALTDEDRRAIHESRRAEDDAYWTLDSLDDLDAAWDAFLAHGPDVVKVYLLDSAADLGPATSGFTGLPTGRGLSPEVLRAVIERAHAAGLRVIAHVETGADVRLAVASGVDGFAHLPGYGYGAGTDDPYLIDDETIAASGDRGVIYIPTAVVGDSYNRDRPSRAALGRDLQRRQLRTLRAAGARIALGADRWNATSAAEARFLEAHDFFDRATLLDLWTRETPQVVFPERAIGRLAPGFEASLLALACDPLADWACTSQIERREKQGAALGAEESASGPVLRYEIAVDRASRSLRVEGVWRGGDLDAVERWAVGTDADSSAVDAVQPTADGVRFEYAVEIPQREVENSLLASLSPRRLRAWHWEVLRYPVVEGAAPEGAVSLAYSVPSGWKAATAFGDASTAPVEAPGLDAALRSPILAADLRLIEVETGAGTSRLAVRAGHPVPDSVFALGFDALVETADRYVGGRETPAVLFAGLDLLEGKRSFVPGNFAATAEAASFLVLQHGSRPDEPGFWGTIAHEYLHGWTPVAFTRATPAPTPVEGRLWPWFREGLTNYLGYRIAHLAGLASDEEWASALTRYVRDYEQVEPGSPVTGARAYSEGLVIGLGLDAALAAATDGEATIRDWFGVLLERHAGTDGTPLTLDAMRAAANEMGGASVAALFDQLVSTDPPIALAALAAAVDGSGIVLRETDDGTVVSLDVAVGPHAAALIDPFGERDVRVARRVRLQRAYDAAAPFEYPRVPSAPPASAQLAAFADGLDAPIGNSWREFAYGQGSAATITVEGGALRVEGQAGSGYSGAGTALSLGTPDETVDLSAYDGLLVEIEVAEGAVVVQFASSRTGVIDPPAVGVGDTDGRVQLRLPWAAFEQRAPVEAWMRDASAVQVLVRGLGEQSAAFTLYDVRLFRDDPQGTR